MIYMYPHPTVDPPCIYIYRHINICSFIHIRVEVFLISGGRPEPVSPGGSIIVLYKPYLNASTFATSACSKRVVGPGPAPTQLVQ